MNISCASFIVRKVHSWLTQSLYERTSTLEISQIGPWTIKRSSPETGRTEWPRVALLHSFYRSASPSGENIAVESQFEMLSQHGVDVTLIGVHSDTAVSNNFRKIETGLSVARGSGLTPPSSAGIETFDILHVHNTFPNISHRWLAEIDIPKVATVHNYRAFCSVGTFTRNDHRCFECVDGSPWRAFSHACYRDSRLATLPIVLQQSGPHSWLKFLQSLAITIIPGDSMRIRLQDFGIQNAITLPQPTAHEQPQKTDVDEPFDNWLFVGRLDQDKGIKELLGIWPTNQRLTVVGSGPLYAECLERIRSRKLLVQMIGTKTSHEVAELMSQSKGLIFPSKALEGAPLVYGEAMAAGLPVIASQGNILTEQIRIDSTGASFDLESESSIIEAIDFVMSNREYLAKKCRALHRSRYTEREWLRGIQSIYELVLSHGR